MLPGEVEGRSQRSLWRDALARLLRNRLAVVGAVLVLALIAVALLAPILAPFDPTKQDYARIAQPPSGERLLGTDGLGRDLLSRLIWGARISISVGIFTQLIVLAVGIPVGALAGMLGGRVDNLLMRFTDVMYAFPDLLLVILFRAVFGASVWALFLAIGLAAWVGVARLTRGQLLSLKERDFVQAARMLGADDLRIVTRHLLPNALGPLIVYVTFNVPRAIFAEAALSYIGIGIAPPTPSWGNMIQEGGQAIFAAPWQVLFPGIAIAVTMMAFTFLGDGLRDALDPRMTR
ncbi:MAG: oligopeptide transport system permease protein [Chloroflexota bacterium]|jgi:oligopeptide transport system permease protein|nr:oligopeptide transport system permease protein [Chloroflexota bacterium]